MTAATDDGAGERELAAAEDLLRALVDDAPDPDAPGAPGAPHDRKGATLTARVRWLERVVAALGTGALASDKDIVAARTDLQAAIGAVVAWGRGPRTPESVAELELVMRALLARGLSTIYDVLARDLRALAGETREISRDEAAACASAATALQAVAESVRRGEPVPATARAALAGVRARLPAEARGS